VTDVLSGKRLILGVSGSIAAFKALALASELVKAGAQVDVILTPAARQFVTPLSFSAIVHRPVIADLFEQSADTIAHVSIGVGADGFIVAPATADCIAGLALGLADDALRATALSTRAPLFVAPAMETLMLEHEATRTNLETLRQRGATIVAPASGHLASGRSGRGRMAEPAEILQKLREALGPSQDLQGRRIVVTAGGTQEPIDPVRFIGNHSSGKMGYAVANAARARGASVVLIVGSTALPPPVGVDVRHVTSALEMQDAVHAAVGAADAIIMAAAVADYRVAEIADHKLKRGPGELTLRLVPNPDIIAGISSESLVKVGFAAETDDLIANARSKLDRKKLDLIVANDVSAPDSGFGSDTNQVILIDRNGSEELPLLPKREVADRVLDRVVALLRTRSISVRAR
jgi:phosphopantothenoylcysteine decarboxylase / phosphopantothenate---cysteine ligase